MSLVYTYSFIVTYYTRTASVYTMACGVKIVDLEMHTLYMYTHAMPWYIM